jgi:hypothetical protein
MVRGFRIFFLHVIILFLGEGAIGNSFPFLYIRMVSPVSHFTEDHGKDTCNEQIKPGRILREEESG